MKPYLLDVNVLLALAWPNHIHYTDAQSWFAAKARGGFGTCPMTQTGFVRISSNPGFTSQAVRCEEALAMLDRIVHLPKHEFWADDLTLRKAVERLPPLAGHRQITDAYLIALASAHGGMLATLDRATLALGRGIGAVEAII